MGLAYFFIAKIGLIKGKIRKLICTNTWTRKFVATQRYRIKVVTRIVWLMAKSRQFQHIRNQKTHLHEYLSSEICDF